jgi:hypothetical protein
MTGGAESTPRERRERDRGAAHGGGRDVRGGCVRARGRERRPEPEAAQLGGFPFLFFSFSICYFYFVFLFLLSSFLLNK